MATYSEFGYTPLFKVNDVAALRRDLNSFSHIRVFEEQGKVRLYAENDGGIWECVPDDFDWASGDAPEDHEVDIIQLVQEHLPLGEATYFLTVGQEGVYFLNAWAEAIRGGKENAGQQHVISLGLEHWLKREMQELWFGIRIGGEVVNVP